MSNSLQTHGLQQTRLSSPSLSPRICSNSCSLSWWCYLTISSSAAFSFCLQIFPSIRVFSSESALHGQSVGASASVLPMNIQGWFPLGLTGLISSQSKGLSRVFFSTTIQKHQFFATQEVRLSLQSNSHIHTWYWKNIALIIWTFVGKVISLLFNTLSGFVTAFLPRSKYLLFPQLQSLSSVIWQSKKKNLLYKCKYKGFIDVSGQENFMEKKICWS